MEPMLVGIIGFLVLFVILFAGMPIGLSMALVGFVGWVVLAGFNGAIHQLGTVPFATVASFTLAVLPMFVLMGEWAYSSGLADDAFTAAQKALGRLPGGLAISCIGTSAVFAACTGSSVASAATMARVTLPSMRKYKYNPGLALGTIAAGGTLGILIPPSNPMILYAIITGTSVGKLFMGGFIPGILLSFLFIGTIYVICRARPDMGPIGEKTSLREVLSSVKGLWSGFFLVAVVFVGIWGGVFSPSEAGAIGAFVSLVIIFLKKGFNVPAIVQGLTGTVRTTAMVFIIIIGAMIFGDFMTLSQLPAAMVDFIKYLQLSPTAVLVILMVVYIILGCPLDELAMLLITMPIVFPVIKELGIDPVHFGILFVINSQMGTISPPYGMVVFVLAGMAKEVSMYTIFRGVLPFFVAMLICMGLIIAFPEIALWLPNTMRR